MRNDMNRTKRGIALVVVLGFLTVLTLMAIGMAIAMRTERLASSSYLDMVQARNYCQAGMADALVWTEEYLSGTSKTNFVIAPNFMENPEFGQFYWVLPSIDPDGLGDTFVGSFADGKGTNFMDYVPVRYQYELLDPDAVKAQWIHVRDKNNRIVGRYMSMTFDASAFIDLNYHRREILPGFKAGGDNDLFKNATAFYQERNDEDIRYETQGDVINSNPNIYRGEYYGEEGDAADNIDWFYWSYTPPMKRIEVFRDSGLNKVRYDDFEDGKMLLIPTESGDISNERDEIIRYLGEALNGASWQSAAGAATLDEIHECLVDFTDDDHTPAGNNFNRVSVESVPMIN
jgi:hypothetical protein